MARVTQTLHLGRSSPTRTFPLACFRGNRVVAPFRPRASTGKTFPHACVSGTARSRRSGRRLHQREPSRSPASGGNRVTAPLGPAISPGKPFRSFEPEGTAWPRRLDRLLPLENLPASLGRRGPRGAREGREAGLFSLSSAGEGPRGRSTGWPAREDRKLVGT